MKLGMSTLVEFDTLEENMKFCKENDIYAVVEVKREKELKASIKYLKENKYII